ncbi:MAG: T9SS type A sorting domain-containing protein [Bacteroidetes bacterium]|nr:MAG: T9SS type A sorting domain-containing protein [Bacteroidota bacterium]
MRYVYSIVSVFLLLPLLAGAQLKYRTFSQDQLANKQDRYAGRSIGSDVQFVIKNTFSTPRNVLSAHVSSPIVSLVDSGGFPKLKLMNYRTTIVAEGKILQPGDSVVFTAKVKRIVRGTKITGWQMRWKDTTTVAPATAKVMMPGSAVSTITMTHGLVSKAIAAAVDRQIIAQPTGGNVREYLYAKELKKPAGIVLGIAKNPENFGWVRSFRSDIGAFGHTGTPRCFDSVLASSKKKPFVKEVRNPSVRIHNNHLLGALHALKFSMLANDSAMTEPFDPDATLFRWLIYFDSTNLSDRFNGMTIQEISNLTDTALTYCNRYAPEDYVALDQCITRILDAFSGDLEVSSMRPMKVMGTKSLSEVPFLHENPAAMANVPRRKSDSSVEIPLQNGLLSNYPNPFNPTTTLSFTLSSNSLVTLKVFNLLGQEVATLLDQSDLEEGEHAVDFEANNLSSGAYYYRIRATNVETGNVFTDVRKMVLMR